MRTYKSGAYTRSFFNFWDIALIIILFGILLSFSKGLHEMRLPASAIEEATISLAPSRLPDYALRTVLRMLIALIFSLSFAVIYGTVAAKYKRAENILIPILDIFQSVPILGFLSFTITWFLSLFPGSSLGYESAVIFAAFANQAPNMTFSFYQSLKTLPKDLIEACALFRLSPLETFFKLELPFAAQGLIWNSMMSMSGGWFLLVASEAVTIGGNTISLPGMGSYIAKAISEQDLSAILYSILTMFTVILLCDQLFFRPLIVWADKFRYEATADLAAPKSIVVDIFYKTSFHTLEYVKDYAAFLISWPFTILHRYCIVPLAAILTDLLDIFFKVTGRFLSPAAIDLLWYGSWCILTLYCAYVSFEFTNTSISWQEFPTIVLLGFYTLLRVLFMVIIAVIVWVPIGIGIGLNPKLAEKIAPLVQFAAAFPANFLFPFAVIIISHYQLNANLWVSPLMILGTQWYILFNTIAGTSAFPSDLKESAKIFHVKGWLWWKRVMLPGLMPYIITGIITASGGAWNASIVAESISWGDTTITAKGLGSYIVEAASKSEYHRIAAGIVVMSLYVIAINRFLWRPLYKIASSKGQLN